jgi:hypothetical protein
MTTSPDHQIIYITGDIKKKSKRQKSPVLILNSANFELLGKT